MTYYNEWSYNYGSCGQPFQNMNPYLVALSFYFMQPAPKNNPNNHPLCGPKYCVKVVGP